MITDKLTTFALSEALAGGAPATAMIGSAVDTNDARDIGAGHPLYLVITAATALSGTGTVEFDLRTAATSGVTTGDTSVLTTTAFVGNNVAAGDILYATSLPIEGQEYNRWLQLSETTTTAAVSGSINAVLTMDPQAYQNYPEGRN